MPAVKQVVELTIEEIRKVLIEHCKKEVEDAGGKQLQGKSTVEFKFGGDIEKGPTLSSAAVSFERAGK
jgi:hypothetical protein